MSINVNVADEREIGQYSGYVKSVRNTTVSDDMLMAVLKIQPQTIRTIRFVIGKHPDWDDEDVAEEVLDLEDEGVTDDMDSTTDAMEQKDSITQSK